MASANKKFLLNLTSTRSYFKKRFTGSQESLNNADGVRRPNQLNASPMLLSAGGGLRPCLLPDNSLLRSSSATDVMAETEAEAQNDVDDLPALTQNVRQLIQALSILKNTINSMSDLSKDAVQTEAHEKLEIVLNVMKMTLNRFPCFHSAEILTAVQSLITKVDGCEFDGSSHCKDEIIDVIESLALVISNSVSDCLTVGSSCENTSNLPKTKSLSCLAPAANGTNSKTSEQGKEEGRRNHEQDVLGAADVLDDSILYKLESGVEIALLRAETWSKYTKELVAYVERRINLWGEFSRSLLKLAKSVEQNISEDTFLPLQSLFCTALTQDIELASMSQAARTLILNQTFVTTLNQRRTEHDKVRKNLKYTWTKQVRKLHDSITNLRKAKESYISRQQDYKKIREMALKAENESLSLSAAGGVNAAKADAKVEKKKKQEDEAMQKAIEAETFYKHCVREANDQQKQLEQVKCQVLRATKQLLTSSDAVLKETTSGYFKLMNTIMETIPQQFQTLHYQSELYEEGSHYLEYVNQLQASEYALAEVRTFVFEPYGVNVKDKGNAEWFLLRSSDPNDTQNDSMHGHQELSKTHSSGLSKGEDSDSMSGGSSMSLESSPTTSPYQHNRKKIITSNSMAELMAQGEHDMGDDVPAMFRGARLSLDAQSHMFRKLRAPSKCAQCDNLIYMHGAECEKCGLASHKKCLEILRLSCTDQNDSPRTLVTLAPRDTVIQEVPFIVTKCIQEIDKRGLSIKGIYRISGVKSRVEQVCQSFETEQANVDLSDQPPNVIANVLKLYLRQLPEPLLTYRLYLDFVQLAKDEVHGQGLTQLLSSLSQLIEQLPPAHHKTCNILMYHLNRVAKNHEVNQMSATNLGIVFGPTLLKPKDGAASLNYLIETPYQTRIIELLIKNVQVIFGPDEGATAEGTATDSAASSGILRKKSPIKAENSADFTTPGYASWYAPETTLDLLDELAKEEPHFLSLQEGHSVSSDVTVAAAAAGGFHQSEETSESRETEDRTKASNEKVSFT